MAYVPTGTNNRDNAYYKRANNSKVARFKETRAAFIVGSLALFTVFASNVFEASVFA